MPTSLHQEPKNIETTRLQGGVGKKFQKPFAYTDMRIT